MIIRSIVLSAKLAYTAQQPQHVHIVSQGHYILILMQPLVKGTGVRRF
jgi:hypothetical protein